MNDNDEVTIPIYLAHTVPVNKKMLQQISKLIQDDKVTFQPAYTIAPDGTMTIRHISMMPKQQDIK